MQELKQKYIESLDYIATDRIREFLEELELPHNAKCVDYILDNWIKEHKEYIEYALEDNDTFEIDSEDVVNYWMNYVTHLINSVE